MTMKGFKVVSIGLLTVGLLAGCSATSAAKKSASSAGAPSTSKKVARKSRNHAKKTQASKSDTKKAGDPESSQETGQSSSSQMASAPTKDSESETSSQNAETLSTITESSSQVSSVAGQVNKSTPASQSSSSTNGNAIANGNTTTVQAKTGQQPATSTQDSQPSSASTQVSQQPSAAQAATAILIASGQDHDANEVDQLSVVSADPKWGNITPGSDGQVHIINSSNGISSIGYTITGDTVRMYRMPSAVSGPDWVNPSTGSFSLQQAINQSKTNPVAASLMQKFSK